MAGDGNRGNLVVRDRLVVFLYRFNAAADPEERGGGPRCCFGSDDCNVGGRHWPAHLLLDCKPHHSWPLAVHVVALAQSRAFTDDKFGWQAY